MLIARDLQSVQKHAATVREVYLNRMDLFEVPELILNLPELQVLDLSGNPIQALPDALAQLKKLDTLILKNTQIPAVPAVISKLTSLKKLVLDGNNLPYLPETLSELTKLKVLHLADNRLRSWPEMLCCFPNLSTLVLSDNQFATLPPKIGQLPSLTYIDLRHNPLHSFPRGLGAIPNLEFVLLEDHLFQGPSEPKLLDQITRFFRNSCSGKISPSIRQNCLDILLTHASQLAALPRSEALAMLNAPFPDVQRRAPETLYLALPSPFGQEKPRSVCMPGTFRTLRQSASLHKLQALGIETFSRPQGQNCIVICGERPGKKLDAAIAEGFAIGVEGHLADFLRQQQGEYLSQSPGSDPATIANLMQLLHPWTRENIELALLLIEGGGMPADIPSEILALHLFHPDEDLRTRSGKIFNRFTTRALQQYVSRCVQNARLSPQDLDIDVLLRSLSKNPGLNPVPLTRAALSQHKGMAYLLELPPNAQAQLWPAATHYQKLNLEDLGLSTFPETIIALNELHYLFLARNQLRTLPPAIGQMQHLKSLELESNLLHSLPEEFGNLSQLIRLDLRGNRLHQLPASIGRLQSLKALRLDLNPLQGLPDNLAQLTGLEMLSLYNSLNGVFPEVVQQLASLISLDLGDGKIATLPTEAGQLQQLQAFNIPRNPITHLPEWLGSLPKLRHLDLSYCKMAKLPESLAESKTLERIYLLRDDSMNWEQVTEILSNIPSLQGVNFKYNRIAPKMQKHIEKHLNCGKRKVYYGN
ncbi:MAG TPA: hypothetical protein ENJ82_08740 [Bacteroidetes bacterium]|nr:hypothetical protein [Bacteroidota bacterium]